MERPNRRELVWVGAFRPLTTTILIIIGLGWLARYQLPVPSSAYSQAQVDLHKQQHNYLQDYQVEVEYLQWYADYVPPITWKQFSTDPTWGYCNTTFITLKNGTWSCRDDAWVGIPTYIEQVRKNT